MFSSLALAVLLASSALVAADPNPNTPGPGAVYKAGTPCPIAWGVDSTGLWKTMNIQLMTGDNWNMVALTTVGTVDATSTTMFSWTCPEVTLNSAIYFYQFTMPAANHTLWTTRFAIASDSGATTLPPNTTQPDGEKIPWGKGALSNPASATAPPSGGASSIPVAGTAAAASPLTTASSSDVPSSSLSPAVMTPETSGAATGSPASTSSGVVSNASNANTAMPLSVDGRIFQAMIALSIAATGFTTLL